MNDLRRNISAFTLLLVLIGPGVFTYSYLKYQRKQIKRTLKWRMIASTDRKGLVHFSFTAGEAEKELIWEHSKEFEYRGKMYDVVDCEITGDTIHYTCWLDHEETALNKKLSGIVSLAWGQNDNKKEKEGRLISYFKSLYFEEVEGIAFRTPESLQPHHDCPSGLTTGHGRSQDKVPKA